MLNQIYFLTNDYFLSSFSLPFPSTHSLSLSCFFFCFFLGGGVVFVFESKSQVSQASLNSLDPLPPCLECWDYSTEQHHSPFM